MTEYVRYDDIGLRFSDIEIIEIDILPEADAKEIEQFMEYKIHKSMQEYQE